MKFPNKSNLIPNLNFFLWDYIKNKVMVTVSIIEEDMETRIRITCVSVTPLILSNIRKTICKRLNKCLEF